VKASQRLFGIVLLTILFAATTYADTFTFSTIPAGGSLSAPAGSTVGWGYSVTNNSLTQWLVFTNIDADPFTHGTADSSVFDFPIVAPQTTVTQVYNGTNGLYKFTWDASAPAGTSNSGQFVLGSEWWNGDPLGSGQKVSTAPDFKTAYSVTVASSAVPEGSSLPTLACGVGGLLLLSFLRKKRALTL
jgi:hypothetical protein